MRNRFTIAAVMAVAAVGMLTATEASAAKKGPVSVSLSDKGSKGYDWSAFGSDQGVFVSATGKDGFASYSGKGKVSAKKIKATFKGYGKVKMKFKKKGKAKHVKPPKGCTGPDSIVQNGTWKGTFSFKGENGYSKLSTKEAKGSVSQAESTKPLDCSGGGGGGPKPKQCVTLSLFDSGTSFQATKIENQNKPSFSVNVSDEKNGISIFRGSSTSGGTFDYDVDGQTATVKPSNPFSGTGDYANSKLTGSLKAEVPGDTVSIKGDAFLSEGKNCF